MTSEYFFLKIEETPLNKKLENPTDQIFFCIHYAICKPPRLVNPSATMIRLQSTVDLLQNNPVAAKISLVKQSDCLGIDLIPRVRLITLIVSHLKLVINSESGLPSLLIFKVLNVKMYHCLRSVKDEVLEDVCSICLEDIDKYGARTRCRHVFHRDCITKWLDKSKQCPLCRSAMCGGSATIGPIKVSSVEDVRQILVSRENLHVQ